MIIVYDSGLGGLSLFKLLKEKGVKLSYLADNKFFPYGTKNDGELIKIIERVIDYLLNKGYHKIILACNTASTIYMKYLDKRYNKVVVPIIMSTIKELEKYPNVKTVGIIATNNVAKNDLYGDLIRDTYKLKTITIPCSDLVDLCEQMDRNKIIAYMQEHFQELNKEIDALILGCTHFNLIEEEIKAFFNARIPIILSGRALLDELELNCEENSNEYIYLTSYNEEYIKKILYLHPTLTSCKFESLNI